LPAEEVLARADAVAEQRALCERRRGVDRQHADRAVPRALELRQRAEQRRLANAGRSREPDDHRLPGARVDLADELPPVRVVVLDQRDAARERALVAVHEALSQVGGHWTRHDRRQRDHAAPGVVYGVAKCGTPSAVQ
jgi:hypothetical protein